MLTKRKARDKISDGDPFISRKKILIYISWGLDSVLNFISNFLSILKISKTLVFFLKCLIIQRVAKDQFLQRKFSLDVLKKTKVLIIFKTDKKWFIKKL